MNRTVLNRGSARSWCCAMMAGLVVLSWAWPAVGGQKQSIQSMAIPVGYTPGESRVTPGGTTHVEGWTLVYMVLSENPLTAGRLTVTGHFNGDLALDGVGSGPSTFEIGTWDLSSGLPIFTASAARGLWDSRWESQGILGGASMVKAVGQGVAGEVEGMVYAVEGEIAWDSSLETYVTHYSGWLLDPKK